MEKTPQNLLNDKFLQLITELTDTIVDTSKSRDILLAIQEFHTKRIDALENKIDILMSERAFKELEEDVGAYIEREGLGDNLNKIVETEITPKALIKLGFEEVYQGIDFGEPGYIFYSLDIKGVGFYSIDTDSKDFHVKMDNDEYEIRNLRKLGDLILSLTEL